MPAAIARTRVLICLLFLVSFTQVWSGPAAAQQSGILPVLHSVLTTPPSAGLVVVHGTGFTPGGLVSIVLYDSWGHDAYVPVRTVASLGQFGPNGSADPAHGYVAPGSIADLLDLASDTVYGPNGSLDPASGYVSGGSNAGTAALRCNAELMVRAYDHRTGTWTDTIDIVAEC